MVDLRKALNLAGVYTSFQRMVGGDVRERFVSDFLRPLATDRMLDIGCGPGDILSYLPDAIDYVGFDLSEKYINSARRRYTDRGQFHCQRVSASDVKQFGTFDIVLAHGVVHHLDDAEAGHLFELAAAALAPGGRLVTFDGCFVEKQSRIARRMLAWDRGKFVRCQPEYESLAQRSFASVEAEVRHDLLRIPYTHLIMQCREPVSTADHWDGCRQDERDQRDHVHPEILSTIQARQAG